MLASSGAWLLQKDAVRALTRDLFSLAALVTPHLVPGGRVMVGDAGAGRAGLLG